MADFPTITTTKNSRRIPVPGIRTDRGEDGRLRTRSLHTAQSYQFDLELLCSAANRTSVLEHFADHINEEFSYTWPDGSVAYTARYVSEPFDAVQGDETWWLMRVSLEGVAA
jgi:hypothetical protein